MSQITQTHLESLKYNCCDRCGQVHRPGMGIYETIKLPCYGNHVKYTMHVGSGFLKIFQQAIDNLYGHITRNSMSPFHDLIADTKYMNPMPDFDTATDFEKKCYYWLRQDEVKHILRLQKLVKAEEDFYLSY